jgi:hypothetical protein
MNAGMFSSEKSQLCLDSLSHSDGVVDAVGDNEVHANDKISISNDVISNFIEDLGCEENQLVASSTKKAKMKPKRVIDLSTATIDPTENDILFGRGSKSNKHPGNIRFREKARELGSWYISCSSKEEKYKVSVVLVEFMKGENRRFLEKVGPEGLWYEVVGNDIRKKASKALRDEGNRVEIRSVGQLQQGESSAASSRQQQHPRQCRKREWFAASALDAAVNRINTLVTFVFERRHAN